AAERDQDPRGREEDRAQADRADQIESRGLARRLRGQDTPREREPGRAQRYVDEEDPAPIDRREKSTDERPDRRTDGGRRAHDPELGAAPAARDRFAQQAETVGDERGRRDRLIYPEHGKH